MRKNMQVNRMNTGKTKNSIPFLEVMRFFFILIIPLSVVLHPGCSTKTDPISTDPGSVSTHSNRYPIKVETKYGYVDIAGKMIIKPQFFDARSFSDGLAPVSIFCPSNVDGWGYINDKGKWVIKPQFTYAEPFSEGMAVVCKKIDDKFTYGYIDTKGKRIIPIQFLGARDFSENLAWVKSPQTGKWGLIDKMGRFLVSPNLDDAFDFSEGLAAVKIRDMYGYINTSGKLVIKLQFVFVGAFKEGLARVQVGDLKTGKMGFIDKTGKMVINPDYYLVFDFFDGLAPVKVDPGDTGKWGYIDRSGKMVIKPMKLMRAESFTAEDLAPILSAGPLSGGIWGFIDRTGKIVIEPQFYNIGGFQDGICRVGLAKGKTGYIDVNGKLIYESTEPQVSPADRFEDLALGNNRTRNFVSMLEGLPLIYVLLILVFTLTIDAIILLYAANYIGISDVNFIRCLAASACMILLNSIASVIMTRSAIIPSIVFSCLSAVVIAILVIKFIFATEWGKAFMTCLAMILIAIAIFFALACGYFIGSFFWPIFFF